MSAVLIITTHGEIQVTCDRCTLDHTIEQFEIPADMTIVQLSAVPPSAPNLLPDYNVQEFISKIKIEIRSIQPDTPIPEMEKIVGNIQGKLMELDEEPGILNKEFKEGVVQEDEEVRRYHQLYHYNYNIETYNGSTMFNKKFYRDNCDVSNVGYNWKLNLIIPGQEITDIMPRIYKRLRDDSKRTVSVRAEDVIKYLYGQNIKKLIIIDLSCNVFRTTEGYGINPRDERTYTRRLLSARRIKQRVKGGGKTKKRRHNKIRRKLSKFKR